MHRNSLCRLSVSMGTFSFVFFQGISVSNADTYHGPGEVFMDIWGMPLTQRLQFLSSTELPNKNFPAQNPRNPSQFSVWGIKFRPIILTRRYFWILNERSVNASFQDAIPSGVAPHAAHIILSFENRKNDPDTRTRLQVGYFVKPLLSFNTFAI